MKVKKLTLLSLMAISLFTGCGDKKENIKDHMIEKKIEKPTFFTYNLSTSNGVKIDILQNNKNVWKFGNIKDKVILLDFFGTWCPPCKAEIPHLNNIRKKYNKDLEIIGIDIGKRSGGYNSDEEIKIFKERFNMQYPVATGVNNSSIFQAVGELNRAGSIPFMILFDKKGNYLTHYIGMVPEEMIVSDIEKALKIK